MAREFRSICRALRDSDELYYGERRARRLAEWFESARALQLGRTHPAHFEENVLVLASQLLELGRTEDALSLLERTRRPPGEPPILPATTDRHDPAVAVETAAAPNAIVESTADAGNTSRVRRLALRRDAHLQAGEDQNCLLRHTAASCILPFRPEALHTEPEHARRAAEISLAILELKPDSISARWLLNVMRMVTGDYPEGVPESLRLPADSFTSDEEIPRWTDRAPELGVNVSDLAGGAVMDDFDGDGWLDLITTTADPCDHMKAFRNDGSGRFEEVTRAWGLEEQLGGLNLVHGDVDGDGRLDLLVLRGGWLNQYGRIRNSLLRNELGSGRDRFVDVTRAAGLAEPAYPTQAAAFADYDGDGDLDLYIGNEAWIDRPHPSQLFRNDGGGNFTDVAAEAAVANLRYAKSVAWGDYDDDGDPDLYVSNIGANRLYRNEGDGTFTDVASRLGVTAPAGRSFVSWFFDYDNDGRLDLFVADYGATPDEVMASYFGPGSERGHPLVYRNEGGRFREVSSELGLRRPLLPMGANYGDIDGDGWLDIYLGTGNPLFEALVPNVMYRNIAGARFADVSFSGGFAHLQKGHGVAFGDIDGDGDQDLLHQLGGFFPGDDYGNALFENPGAGTNWITLRLEGRRANRYGVGARIAVRLRGGPDGARTIHLLAGSGGSFGGSSLQQEIGIGRSEAIEEIVIRWPGSGSVQRFQEIAPNRVYLAVEGEPALAPQTWRQFELVRNGPSVSD